jgi:hypothetical protein
MRTLAFLLLVGTFTLAGSPLALAQVTDAERSAARQLFKEGDELQRAGKFTEALDKFGKAQQIFSAPTNLLRIAECQAALGHLVESTESYRAVVRTPLPAGSPPAFQAAVDQARGELTQVEPRVPRLVVQVDPGTVPNPQMQIDGQAVPSALIGEPFPLDPGQHKVLVYAPGYASTEQSFVLKEHETKTLPVSLKAMSGVTYAAGTPGTGGTTPPPPPGDGSAATTSIPPPPPPIEGAPAPVVKRSRAGLLFGLHLGFELPTGSIPLPTSINASDISGGGLAYAFDGGLRFARQWYVGLTLEHAGLGAGKDPAQIANYGSNISSDTTALGLLLALITNPDKVSFYGAVGLQNRWYNVNYTDTAGQPKSGSYSSGEVLLGVGLWIPGGRSVRILPEATVGLGTFSVPGQPITTGSSTTTTQGSPGHAFFMLGVGGYYNIDL